MRLQWTRDKLSQEFTALSSLTDFDYFDENVFLSQLFKKKSVVFLGFLPQLIIITR